jgi:hypothetical protein
MIRSVRAQSGRSRRSGVGRALVQLALSVGALCGCAPQAEAPARVPRQETRSDGLVCKGLLDHFLGLPASLAGKAAARTEAGSVPLTGRWWIRGCSTSADDGALSLHLSGPGWYWVDMDQGDVALHQQVPFELEAQLWGTFRAAYSDGVVSFWFDPTREPKVTLVASSDLNVEGSSVWGSFLRALPFFPIRSLTAQELSKSASSALRDNLGRGATVTYDIVRGQSDMALGKLGLGKTPVRPFSDGSAWLTNDRLLLPPVATQVLGPIEPLERRALDVDIERGRGIAYRALCIADMPAALAHVMSGTPEDIPRARLLASETITGAGSHRIELHVTQCPFYLVLSSADAATALAAVRVQG